MSIVHVGRELNTKKVIKFIREKGPISRKEISDAMDIPQPTITRIIEQLLQAEMIKEVGTVPSSRGRRQVLLALNAKSCFSIGVEIGRTAVKSALVDLEGNLTHFEIRKSSKSDRIEHIIAYLKSRVEQLMQSGQVDSSAILGVGIGIPGWLNETKEGYISPSNFYGQTKIPLRALLEEALPYPIIIDNNANVAALAEKWFGKGRGVQNLVYIHAEIGIGSGVIIHDTLYRGLSGKAGEIAHTIVDLFGDQCTCGSYGCLETLVSIPRILERLKKVLKVEGQNERSYFQSDDIESIDFDQMLLAYRKGSQVAGRVLEETGKYLGIGVANVTQHFAPELIIIGGELGTCEPVILNEIKAYALARDSSLFAPASAIVVSELEELIVLGAAAQVIDDAYSLYSLL